MCNATSRLVLGTAQLGMKYGVANTLGQPSTHVSQKIIDTAVEQGIVCFDTAVAYGNSEEVLGKSFAKRDFVKVISKLPPALSPDDAHQLDSMVKQSLYRLNLHNLECLMFHREGHLELLDIPDFLAAFVALKETKLVKGLGCSVYTPEAALKALNHEYIDAVQIPASLFDRRFEAAGVFTVAAEKNKVLYLRSGLLQGVLCMQADSLPPYLQPLTSYVRRFHATCEQFSIAPAQLALAWLLDRYPREFVLFGAELPEQVMSNVGGLTTIDFNSKLRNTLEQICPPQTTELLNPSYWRV